MKRINTLRRTIEKMEMIRSDWVSLVGYCREEKENIGIIYTFANKRILELSDDIDILYSILEDIENLDCYYIANA